MGQSTHVVGFKPPDEKWKKMKAVWDACDKAGMDPPKEVMKFFNHEPPDERGVAIEEKELKAVGCVRDWGDESYDGFELDVKKLLRRARRTGRCGVKLTKAQKRILREATSRHSRNIVLRGAGQIMCGHRLADQGLLTPLEYRGISAGMITNITDAGRAVLDDNTCMKLDCEDEVVTWELAPSDGIPSPLCKRHAARPDMRGTIDSPTIVNVEG